VQLRFRLVTCDPRQPGEIADATLRWIRENVPGGDGATWEGPLTPADGGMTTFIWFGRLRGDDLPDPFRGPLALRVFGDVGEDVTLEREHAILDFVVARGYPAPTPLAAVKSVDPANPVGLPWMVLPHLPGDPLASVMVKGLLSVPARVRELAALQARLHAMPIAGCPLPENGPLVDRWFVKRGAEIDGVATTRSSAVFDTLRRKAGIVRDEEPVVCHGDFHPLNVLSDHRDGTWHHVVIDWTDAVVGDLHFDVARTLGIFRVAAIAASSNAERIALRVAAPHLVRIYRRAYERAHPLEPDRLAYWSAAHYLRGWAQITQLHAGAYETARAGADAIPLSVADVLLGRAEHAVRSLP
jgi:aminoglycoside phosphotransferase (APT) family kinase protein